jgi:hypothetical protein
MQLMKLFCNSRSANKWFTFHEHGKLFAKRTISPNVRDIHICLNRTVNYVKSLGHRAGRDETPGSLRPDNDYTWRERNGRRYLALQYLLQA